ncbi:MAG: peptidylprolyl isomerase [Gemmataceae bacterium]
MSLHRLTRSLRQLFSRAARRKQDKARRQASTRLELVALEARETPATLTTGTVSGVAFVDANNNRLREANEPALAGASFTLVGNSDTGRVIRNVTSTGAAGGFRFLNVPTGSYHLIAEPAGGYSPFGGGVPVLLFQGRVNGGQTVGRMVAYRTTGAGSVSLNQFLNTTTVSAYQTQPAGPGTVRVLPRENNAPEVVAAPRDVAIPKNGANQTINLRSIFTDPDWNSRVRIDTNLGSINLDLFDSQSPGTVRNFINYITSNRYDSTIFHRLGAFLHGTSTVRDVLQGGQFRFNRANNTTTLTQVQTDAAIADQVLIPNVPGTIAMAKTGSANSATSQFFFNLIDNTDPLSPQQQSNGGFTVFGKIDPASLPVLNALAAFNVQNKSAAGGQLAGLTDLPLRAGANDAAFPNNTVADDYALIKDVVVVRRPEADTEALRFQVIGNANPNLVKTTVSKGVLTLDVADNATGASRITVRATDRFGVFIDAAFTVTVANGAPTASVSLAPGTALTNTTLTASATVVDPNGDPTTQTFVWKKNGVVVKTTAATAALTDTYDLSVAGNGDKGDTITVEVTATDSLLASALASASTTVADSPPLVSLLTFSPDAPGTNDGLTVTTTATDPDGDAMTFTYVWTVGNAVVKTTANTASLTDSLDLSQTGNGDPGDTVKVTVTPTANGLNGTAVSASRIVA